MTRPFVLALLLVAAGAGRAAAAESLWVRAANTEVRASASPSGALVAKLPIGAKVDVADKSGGAWVKVTATVKGKDVAGWVFGAKLSKDKPGSERFGGPSSGTTVAASEGDTAQAIRGLTPTAESFAARHAVSSADIAAVKRMEALTIPADELATFMKDGKLGEYQQ